MTTQFSPVLKQGSILGGVLLLSGSCIGAGMLAVPVITGMAGFFPSTLMFLLAWLFMTATSLLLLEANLSVGHHLSLVSLAEKTLGSFGKGATWFLFLFLFYSLNVAYIGASGPIVQTLLGDFMGVSIPSWIGSLLFTSLFAFVIYKGVKSVDYFNRVLMFALVISYVVLVFLGSRYVNYENLLQGELKYAFISLPILVISFGFHNMIPSLADYFKGDRKRLRVTIFLGSLIPLFIYLIWEAVMLGIIPIVGKEGLIQGLKNGEPVTEVLRTLIGKSWIASVAEAFSLFAIITSFLAQSLSLVDFLSDGLKIKKEKKNRFFLIILTLLPPFLSAFLYPKVFIHALNIAGGFSAVVLFGIFPVLMVWKLRYKAKNSTPLLFGGKTVLALIFIFACVVFLIELYQELKYEVVC